MIQSPPLAEKLRPASLEEFFGQDRVLTQKGLFSTLLKEKRPLSLLLFGPPGCGKTTLAKIYIRSFKANTLFFHPATHSIADLKKWLETIEKTPLFSSVNILFVDEIHRLNKGQQDAFLPFIEKGVFFLVAATTENPSFCINNALLSRIRVMSLESLNENALEKILDQALQKTERNLLSIDAKKYLIRESQGDARHLLNNLESLLLYRENAPLSKEDVAHFATRKLPLYDRNGQEHYNLISVLHKSIRGSDPDAALYWLSRLLEGGEDPGYIARRLCRIAIEDIGLAEPNAASYALSAWQIYERLGSPEGDLALGQVAIYLALAPKSVSSYKAHQLARQKAQATGDLPPPNSMINAPTEFMKSMGYGKGYLYDPDQPGKFAKQHYFPSSMEREEFYNPDSVGFERELKKRNDFFREKREKK